MTFKKRMMDVVSNRTSYPVCCVAQAEMFIRLNKESNAACVEIKNSYGDIWSVFITRPNSRKAGFDFSRNMTKQFGRERMGEFHKLRQKIRNRNDFLKYDIKMVDVGLRLVHASKSELQDALKFIENVNANEFDENCTGRWINLISPRWFSEIIMWRLVQVSK